MTTCPRCGAENPDGFRFCGSCGAPLAAVAPPAREERKVVTVLFADLVGFTSRAERLDPEDVRAILATYHARLRSELESFGGTVEKIIGDAVVALFGAPAAHEDDPERAVRAALAIRDAIAELNEAGGGDLRVRIGITTGEALVALAARPETGEAMAAGDVVNTASRLQAGAPVDGVLVDERTFRATERMIAFREADAVAAKGKTGAIPVWEALEARARFGVDVAHIPRAALVGRAGEIDVLRGALARTRRERAPQLVTLVGVPGIGKSRLVHELLRVVDDDPELIVWRQGRSLPYGAGVSFWALGEMVKAQAGILETDDDDEATEKLRRSVADFVTAADEARWIERHLRPLVGLVRDGRSDAGPDEAFAAWRRFLEALAESRPAVLVFEDLHWADEGLLDFVEHLVDWASGVPLLVVCTARPELLSRRPGWGGGKPNATTLSLAPLSDDETARLIGLLLDRAVMPAETQAELLARAGGNPLYAEEFVRMQLERGDDAGGLPESVQGIISARLDGLDAEDKALLQDAAVFGKVFWLGAVGALGLRDRLDAERRLHELERRQLVRRERRSSVAAETEYTFWHVLVRDVAYEQIPRAVRAEKHRSAAEWTSSLGGERLEDRADLLAHHYLAALEFARAAGQDTASLAESARTSLRAAGDRALALKAFQAAARFFGEAAALWTDDATRGYVLLGLGTALHTTTMTGRDEIVAARDLLVAAGDVESAAEAEVVLADMAWVENRTGEAMAHIESAARRLEDRPSSEAKVRVASHLSRYLMLAGRDHEAIDRGFEALRLAEDLGLDELRAHALVNIGTARGNLGRREGLDDLERAIEIAERAGSVETVRGYINLASLIAALGDVRRSFEIHQRGLEVAVRYGQRRGERFLRAELAMDAYLLGDWQAASAQLDAFVAETEAGRPHYMEGACRVVRSALRLARDDTESAVADLAVALARGREAQDPQALLPTLAMRAFVESELGEAAAGTSLDELIRVVADNEAPRLEFWLYPALHAFAGLGRADELASVLRRFPVETGWHEAAVRHLEGDLAGAAKHLEELGDLPDAARTRLALGVPGPELARAVAFYESVGATFYLRLAERALAASA